MPSPDGPWWFAWALGVLACALLVAVGVERAARRLLPLVTLLKLSMLFPDQAPTRFSVARTAGSVRRLEARLAETQDDTASREEARTAETILSLSVALQSHDRRTRGHAERVRVFTDLLGEELQLSEADRYRLRWAALMHDIGKLTIAPAILNKPGALDEHEWRLMKGHPDRRRQDRRADPGMARPVGERDRRAPRALRRQGVPERSGRGSISLGGRIVSVADSYDTMTAARSYKKPMAVWAARRELADCAGGQFDPEIVRAFLSISLPKLLWRTGPRHALVQLPFLGRLQEVGLQSVTAMTQGVAAATVAAGVTAMVVAGPTGASAHGHHGTRASAGAADTTGVVPAPSPAETEPDPGGSSPAPSVPTPEPPAPSPGPGDPSDDPSPTPGPATPTPDPTEPGRPEPTPTSDSDASSVTHTDARRQSAVDPAADARSRCRCRARSRCRSRVCRRSRSRAFRRFHSRRAAAPTAIAPPLPLPRPRRAATRCAMTLDNED